MDNTQGMENTQGSEHTQDDTLFAPIVFWPYIRFIQDADGNFIGAEYDGPPPDEYD